MAELRRFYQPVDMNDTLTVQGVSVSTVANAVKGVAGSYAIARGNVVATASMAVVKGLSTITGFALARVGNTGTKANAAVSVTGSASSGTLTVKRWKITAPSTATLIAATANGTVSWVAVGTI